jgi:phage baseplate assembly protein W|tara:strand:+ start:3622 stop:4041 length:420 start_codon:yes stop_codon:yes gene_type:complete
MALKPLSSKDLAKSRSFNDIGMAFGKNPFTDDVSIVKDDNSIKQSIRNLVMTTPGEKPFQPNIGCGVYSLLFEPLDAFSADAIKSEIINTINQYERRVQLRNVNCIPFKGNNKISVTVQYQVVGIPIVEEVKFVLQRAG